MKPPNFNRNPAQIQPASLARMTNALLDQSKISGYVALTRWEKVAHFKAPLGLAVIQLFVLPFVVRYFMQHDQAVLTQSILFISIGPAVLGLVLFLIQRQALKFKEVDSHISLGMLEQRMALVCTEHNWEISFRNETALLVNTNAPADPRVWGERITLVFDQDKWLINSVRDPGIPRRNISRMRGNRENYKVLEGVFKG